MFYFLPRVEVEENKYVNVLEKDRFYFVSVLDAERKT